MTRRPFDVLFLCTGNSARSIIAESLLTHWDEGRFHAYSAGSHPKRAVQPMVLSLLKSQGCQPRGCTRRIWTPW